MYIPIICNINIYHENYRICGTTACFTPSLILFNQPSYSAEKKSSVLDNEGGHLTLLC